MGIRVSEAVSVARAALYSGNWRACVQRRMLFFISKVVHIATRCSYGRKTASQISRKAKSVLMSMNDNGPRS